MLRHAILFVLILVPSLAVADGEKRYKVETPATTVKVGETAKASLRIVASAGSHVSDEAPLKIKLTGAGVKLAKDTLRTEDIAEGKGASPRFEVAVVGDRKGEGSVTAEMTFIVCTKELCERESEKVTIPVTVQ